MPGGISTVDLSETLKGIHLVTIHDVKTHDIEKILLRYIFSVASPYCRSQNNFNFIINNYRHLIMKFGEIVEGYSIPVLNEREIRASAGILFLFILIALMRILSAGDFLLIKYVITAFLTDFIIRVFVHPRYAPSLIIGRLIVGRQVPEYVGATQKKFAWIIGLVLAAVMFALLVVVNAYSIITGLVCLICLIFLFFESAFGICLGCKFHSIFYREKTQYCPGEVCDTKTKQAIQKTSPVQLLIVFGFIAFIVLTVLLFNDTFRQKPHALFGTGRTEQVK
jgi:hypothetical protein